jgi:sucrose-phosphate synthase
MHIVFLNPQGNFDPADSYLTEHPDFGGQLVYVKELAQAMAQQGHKVDIVTRRIRDPSWPEFFANQDSYLVCQENLRILRFPFGGDLFLTKEKLWPHLPELVDSMLRFYRGGLPDFITAHYADGGYAAALTFKKTGIPFSFTGHSLGAQKLDKLGTTTDNWHSMENRFKFSKRIAAERLSMKYAVKIMVSTKQEMDEQYAHQLYISALDQFDQTKFEIIPPGVNENIFSQTPALKDKPLKQKLDAVFGINGRPVVLVSSRLDEKKNIIGVVHAYSEDHALIEKAHLVLCFRGINDPAADMHKLSKEEQIVLREILNIIERSHIQKHVYFLNIGSQIELAATYRYFAKRGSVFALTSLYEPFGLAPLEAAATGLVPVVTKNGGPSEIFIDGSGVLIDPTSPKSISEGLMDGLKRYSDLSKMAIQLVKEKYTWAQTANRYLHSINDVIYSKHKIDRMEQMKLNDKDLIKEYLKNIADR